MDLQEAPLSGDLWAAAAPAAKPHHVGHRERLRDRALSGGLTALPDYELLELFLFRSIPKKDVKPLSKQLLARFGSFAGVLGATPEELRTVKGVGEAVAIADKVFPDGRLHWVLFPSAPNAAYVVGKQSHDEPNRTKTYRNVGIDQYSGEVLRVQDRGGFSAGEKFIEWLFPLHAGEAFGEIGRPVVLLIGLTPLTLYVSGFLRWRQKRRARKRAPAA